MSELKKKLLEVKELCDLGLLDTDEYEMIRRRILRKMGITLESGEQTSPPVIAKQVLSAIPESRVTSEGDRWSTPTRIGGKPPQEEHTTLDTIIPQGPSVHTNSMHTIVPPSDDYIPSAETIVPPMGEDLFAVHTIVPESFDDSFEPDLGDDLRTMVPYREKKSGRPAPQLILFGGSDSETCYQVHKSKVIIGRGRNADIVISGDKKISRVHCEIQKQGTNYYIHDNGSVHGTLLNGKSVQYSIQLNNGDEICLGDTVLQFVIQT